MGKPWDCPRCGKPFTTSRGVVDHGRDKHGAEIEPRRRRKPEPGPEREPSFAERDIAARLAVAMGEPTDDYWLIEGSL